MEYMPKDKTAVPPPTEYLLSTSALLWMAMADGPRHADWLVNMDTAVAARSLWTLPATAKKLVFVT